MKDEMIREFNDLIENLGLSFDSFTENNYGILTTYCNEHYLLKVFEDDYRLQLI